MSERFRNYPAVIIGAVRLSAVTILSAAISKTLEPEQLSRRLVLTFDIFLGFLGRAEIIERIRADWNTDRREALLHDLSQQVCDLATPSRATLTVGEWRTSLSTICEAVTTTDTARLENETRTTIFRLCDDGYIDEATSLRFAVMIETTTII